MTNMSNQPKNDQDSIAQRRQAQQNEETHGKSAGSVVDKKLDGPNRPSV